jgi:A/G-specific adenine glycosylase
MELGALICKPRNPTCLVCPLHDACAARATGRVDELPPPKPKKPARALTIPLYLIRDRRGRVLMRRASGSLMDAMYHLPHGDSSLLEGEPFIATASEPLGRFRHTVTNRRIEFVVYATRVARKPAGYEWIADVSEVPHPSYVRKALGMGTAVAGSR